MNNELLHLLTVRRLPGRLNAEQAAHLLGFQSHDVPVLVKAKVMKPIGNPVQQAAKYFASTEIEKFARDEAWLNRATRVIYNHWRSQNQKNPKRRPETGEAAGSARQPEHAT